MHVTADPTVKSAPLLAPQITSRRDTYFDGGQQFADIAIQVAANVAFPKLKRPLPGFGADYEPTRRDNNHNHDKEMVCALYLIPFNAFADHSFSQL